jgi:hypothetical protein
LYPSGTFSIDDVAAFVAFVSESSESLQRQHERLQLLLDRRAPGRRRRVEPFEIVREFRRELFEQRQRRLERRRGIGRPEDAIMKTHKRRLIFQRLRECARRFGRLRQIVR